MSDIIHNLKSMQFAARLRGCGVAEIISDGRRHGSSQCRSITLGASTCEQSSAQDGDEIAALRATISDLGGDPDCVQPQSKGELTREALFLINDREAEALVEFADFMRRMADAQVRIVNIWFGVILPMSGSGHAR